MAEFMNAPLPSGTGRGGEALDAGGGRGVTNLAAGTVRGPAPGLTAFVTWGRTCSGTR